MDLQRHLAPSVLIDIGIYRYVCSEKFVKKMLVLEKGVQFWTHRIIDHQAGFFSHIKPLVRLKAFQSSGDLTLVEFLLQAKEYGLALI